MIDRKYIRGARAILGWSRDDLSDESGVPSVTIKTFETGDKIPTLETVNKILSAFHRHHIKITANGVEEVDDSVTVIEGENSFIKLLEDVYSYLKDEADEELLILNADDSKSPQDVINLYRRIRSAGIGMRQLVEEGNTYLMGDLDEYRYISKQYFVNRVSLIYGDKYAVIARGAEKKITIFKDFETAEAQRNLFEIVWSHGEKPMESVADERF